MRHHASCKEMDVLLVFHCSQCGRMQDASAVEQALEQILRDNGLNSENALQAKNAMAQRFNGKRSPH